MKIQIPGQLLRDVISPFVHSWEEEDHPPLYKGENGPIFFTANEDEVEEIKGIAHSLFWRESCELTLIGLHALMRDPEKHGGYYTFTGADWEPEEVILLLNTFYRQLKHRCDCSGQIDLDSIEVEFTSEKAWDFLVRAGNRQVLKQLGIELKYRRDYRKYYESMTHEKLPPHLDVWDDKPEPEITRGQLHKIALQDEDVMAAVYPEFWTYSATQILNDGGTAEVLECSKKRFYLLSNGTLFFPTESALSPPEDTTVIEEISIANTFRRFGGDAIMEAMEKGFWKVPEE